MTQLFNDLEAVLGEFKLKPETDVQSARGRICHVPADGINIKFVKDSRREYAEFYHNSGKRIATFEVKGMSVEATYFQDNQPKNVQNVAEPQVYMRAILRKELPHYQKAV